MACDAFRNSLVAAKTARCLIAVYSGRWFDDIFDVGTVTDVGADTYALRAVSPIGLDDGVLVARMQNITRLVLSGRYLNGVARCRAHLRKILKGEFEPAAFAGATPAPSEDLFRWHLEEAAQCGDVVELSIAGQSVVGCPAVSVPSTEYTEITIIGDCADEVPRSRFRFEEIDRLKRAGMEERKLRVLRDLKQEVPADD